MSGIEKALRDLVSAIRHAKYEIARPVHSYADAQRRKLWQSRHDGWIDQLREVQI